MKYRINPCDPTYFHIHECIRENGFVEWKQRNYKYEIGDIIFIYDSAPESRIAYMMEVEQVNISQSNSYDDSGYLIKKQEDGYEGYVVRFKLLKEINSNELTLANLLDHGLKGAPMGPMYAKEPLLSYILDNID